MTDTYTAKVVNLRTGYVIDEVVGIDFDEALRRSKGWFRQFHPDNGECEVGLETADAAYWGLGIDPTEGQGRRSSIRIPVKVVIDFC